MKPCKRMQSIILIREDACLYCGTFTVNKSLLHEFGDEQITSAPSQ